MTGQLAPKRWLTSEEAADVAKRSERTLRNWVRDGVLNAPVRGFYDRELVIAAEQKVRRGRPVPGSPRVVEAAGVRIEVTACGTHAEALNVGLVSLTCKRCVLVPAGRTKQDDADPQ